MSSREFALNESFDSFAYSLFFHATIVENHLQLVDMFRFVDETENGIQQDAQTQGGSSIQCKTFYDPIFRFN